VLASAQNFARAKFVAPNVGLRAFDGRSARRSSLLVALGTFAAPQFGSVVAVAVTSSQRNRATRSALGGDCRQSVSQSISHSVSQSVSQSVSLLVFQSVCQSVS